MQGRHGRLSGGALLARTVGSVASVCVLSEPQLSIDVHAPALDGLVVLQREATEVHPPLTEWQRHIAVKEWQRHISVEEWQRHTSLAGEEVAVTYWANQSPRGCSHTDPQGGAGFDSGYPGTQERP